MYKLFTHQRTGYFLIFIEGDFRNRKKTGILLLPACLSPTGYPIPEFPHHPPILRSFPGSRPESILDMTQYRPGNESESSENDRNSALYSGGFRITFAIPEGCNERHKIC
jgi:hypothetical protein